ncbi:MAG: FAD-binding oxidoreductase [Chitinophagaceae bacterium]|nr:FAD-binding oxidoreductase [Chitinophagaceae bacterium]
MNNIVSLLHSILPSHKIKAKLIDRHAFAADAGFYYLLPQVVVQPDSIEEIKQLFGFAHQQNIPLTFRTGGTSLSGQSITDGILVDLSRNWKKIQPLNNGEQIAVQPAAIGAHANHSLKKFQKKIGPDPASITAAMMGGILSNNSSGMCCGVQFNSYHTVASVHFVLPNGHEYNTAIKEDYKRFEENDKQIATGITSLRNEMLQNEMLVQKIRTKYKIKNTVGYSINAFLDYEHPLDILAHLLIGGEGTLAFIAEAVLKTIPDKRYKTTGLLFFDSPVTAAQNIPLLKSTNAEALELMDRPALQSIEHLDDCPDVIKSLPPGATAILCEYQSTTEEELSNLFASAQSIINQLPLLAKVDFTKDEYRQQKFWKLRKGMYPSVAAVRAKGTTAMLEDVAVPLENLGNAVTDLQALFKKYEYHNAIIFGHAKEGNLHFLITQPVNTHEETKVFEQFNDELAELIIKKYNGSLKAEHGTGRQIAPYVKDEWGTDAYRIMQSLKQLIDPQNILNPGVIINADDKCHLKNLKTMPVVEEEVDKCVECGYCENRCPSRDFTMTPRQRIQVRRSLQRLKVEGNTNDYKQLIDEYQFNGMDTCAVDGMCATDCPVNINTGELIKRLRRENHSASANNMAMRVAKNFGTVERLVKLALYCGNAVNFITGGKGMHFITSSIKKIIPAFPLWTKSLSKPVSITANETDDADVVYFPTCITRMMGADKENSKPISEVIQSVCSKAGLKLYIAQNNTGICCGQLLSSKGFIPAYQHTVNKTIELLWQRTKQGSLPVLMDVTSCTYSLQHAEPYLNEENKQRFRQLKIIDSIDFAADYLVPKLQVKNQKPKVVFHPVCTTHKMNNIHKLKQIGEHCSQEAVVPFNSGCCGMAGDRGFYYPSLTSAATKNEATEVNSSKYDGYYSSGKTCEMALYDATGKNYQSIFYLMDECT